MPCHFITLNSFLLALAVLLSHLFLVGPKIMTKIGQKKSLTKNVEAYHLGATFHAESKNDVSFLLKKINFDLEITIQRISTQNWNDEMAGHWLSSDA